MSNDIKMNYKLLSYPITIDTPLYGDNPPIKIEYPRSIEKGDPANTSIITFHNHTSTHVDAPKHFSKNGRMISDYNIDELIFNSPLIVDIKNLSADNLLITNEHLNNYDEEDLLKSDILILRTGWYKKRSEEIYRTTNPGISNDFAESLRNKYGNIRAIMIDSISISSRKHRSEGRKAHKTFLEKSNFISEPVLLVEDVNLIPDLSSLNRVFIVPLFVNNVDSMPCTIIGEFIK